MLSLPKNEVHVCFCHSTRPPAYGPKAPVRLKLRVKSEVVEAQDFPANSATTAGFQTSDDVVATNVDSDIAKINYRCSKIPPGVLSWRSEESYRFIIEGTAKRPTRWAHLSNSDYPADEHPAPVRYCTCSEEDDETTRPQHELNCRCWDPAPSPMEAARFWSQQSEATTRVEFAAPQGGVAVAPKSPVRDATGTRSQNSSLRNKRPDLSGWPPCKGVAIGVARRGGRRSGERTLRAPPLCSVQVSHAGGPHVASFVVDRPCAGVRACVCAGVAQCAASSKENGQPKKELEP